MNLTSKERLSIKTIYWYDQFLPRHVEKIIRHFSGSNKACFYHQQKAVEMWKRTAKSV